MYTVYQDFCYVIASSRKYKCKRIIIKGYYGY